MKVGLNINKNKFERYLQHFIGDFMLGLTINNIHYSVYND